VGRALVYHRSLLTFLLLSISIVHLVRELYGDVPSDLINMYQSLGTDIYIPFKSSLVRRHFTPARVPFDPIALRFGPRPERSAAVGVTSRRRGLASPPRRTAPNWSLFFSTRAPAPRHHRASASLLALGVFAPPPLDGPLTFPWVRHTVGSGTRRAFGSVRSGEGCGLWPGHRTVW